MNTDRNQSRLVYISGEGYGDGYIPFDGAYFDGRDWILEKVKKGEIIRVKPQDISRNDGVPIVNLRQGKKGKSL
jgi:hypothetical protein